MLASPLSLNYLLSQKCANTFLSHTVQDTGSLPFNPGLYCMQLPSGKKRKLQGHPLYNLSHYHYQLECLPVVLHKRPGGCTSPPLSPYTEDSLAYMLASRMLFKKCPKYMYFEGKTLVCHSLYKYIKERMTINWLFHRRLSLHALSMFIHAKAIGNNLRIE